MTHEQATAYAKASAYDGHTAWVMRKDAEHESIYGVLRDITLYTSVVSQGSRKHHEDAGWEVVETYQRCMCNETAQVQGTPEGWTPPFLQGR